MFNLNGEGSVKKRIVWMNGKHLRWEDATVHISSPIVQYGTGVFEGIRAYWVGKEEGAPGQLYIFKLKEHIDRLFQSSKVQRMDIPFSKNEIMDATVNLLKANSINADIYIRPIVFRGGQWGKAGGLSGKYPIEVAIFTTPLFSREQRMERIAKGIKCYVTSWRKIPDECMPPRVKASGNYMSYKYAVEEAASFGFDNPIVLTVNGKVSEAAAANIFIVRDNMLITPSVTSDILEGITRNVLINIAEKQLDLRVVERDVDKTELYVADEVFLCGTGWEITPVVSVDKIAVADGKPGEITQKLGKLYYKVVTGKISEYRKWLTPVYT